jgi:hypothetical protein
VDTRDIPTIIAGMKQALAVQAMASRSPVGYC